MDGAEFSVFLTLSSSYDLAHSKQFEAVFVREPDLREKNGPRPFIFNCQDVNVGKIIKYKSLCKHSLSVKSKGGEGGKRRGGDGEGRRSGFRL